MKLLAVADHVDPLVYSNNIKERFKNISVILGAGDLDISYYEYIVSTLNKPLYFVFGNHNLKSFSYFRPSKKNIDDTNRYSSNFHPGFGSICVEDKVIFDKKYNLIIAGLGGSRKYNNGEHQFTEYQMRIRALLLVPKLLFYRIFYGRWTDILLTHAPPQGIHDKEDLCHMGFKTFIWFMDKFKPRYLIHGHVHLYNLNSRRITKYRDTTVINAYNHIVINTEKGMSNKVILNEIAEGDFEKAKHKAWIQSIKSILNPEAGELLSFHDIKEIIKPEKEKYLGMQTVEIKKIIGSEDRYQDFNRHFFPKREHLKQRWVNVDKAYLNDIILPPIKLLKINDMYFVRDGNHRVSVALSKGVEFIDAEVIELTSEIPISRDSTRKEILKAVLEYERNTVLNQTGLSEIIPVEEVSFTAPGRWHEIVNHIEGHKYFINMEKDTEIPFNEAAESWYENIYLPVIKEVRKANILSKFPGRTESDLYIWIIKHWHILKEKYGQDYPLDKAANEFAVSHGKKYSDRFPFNLFKKRR